MKIRKFKIDDAEKLSLLIQKTLYKINIQDSPDFAIKELHDEYSTQNLIKLSKKRDIYVATEKNKIIGSIANKNNFISTLFVNYLLKNKGIGKKLLIFIEDKIKKLGYLETELTASLSAISFFEKMNYIETKKQYDKNELTGIFFKKKL